MLTSGLTATLRDTLLVVNSFYCQKHFGIRARKWAKECPRISHGQQTVLISTYMFSKRGIEGDDDNNEWTNNIYDGVHFVSLFFELKEKKMLSLRLG
jgi:hypothetical protein